MAEDLEVGVMLEPKNNLEEEVGDVETGVGGTGGTPAQQQRQEGIIAGGVSRGLLAAGVLGGILSQLKSVQGIIEGVFGVLSRALLPAVEVISELIRPLVSGINDFVSRPAEAAENAGQGLFEQLNLDLLTGQENAEFDFFGTTPFDGDDGGGGGRAADGIAQFLLNPSSSADQTGEATKQQLKQNIDEAGRDKTGGLR